MEFDENNTFIHKCLEIEKFEENWVEFLIKFNFSILSGEYIYDISRILNELKSKLNNYSITDSNFENSLIRNYCYKLIHFYSLLTKNIKDNMLQTLEGVDGSLAGNEIRNELKEDIDIKEIENNIIKNLFELTIYNIALAELDEYLESDDWCRLELKNIKNKFENQERFSGKQTIDISNILEDKCKYLLFKVYYRKQKERILKIDSENDVYKINNNSAVFIDVSDSLFLKKENSFYDFYKKSINHYYKTEKDNSLKDDFSKEIKDFKLEKIHEYTQSYIFRYNKILKNESKSNNKIEYLEQCRNNIKIIINSLESRIINSNNSFDKFSLFSLTNILENTELYFFLEIEKKKNYSSLINNDGINENNINSFFDEIIEIITKNKIQYTDFRKYEQVITFLDEFFEKIIQEGEKLCLFFNKENTSYDIEKLNSINELLVNGMKLIKDKYSDFLNLYSNWDSKMSDQGLLPVYLEMKECVIEKKIDNDFNVEKLNLFLDSSYILPVNYKELEKKIDIERTYFTYIINTILAKIETTYKTKKSNKELEKTKEDLENRLKENEFKTVQIVALFVTLAAFVLAQVKIYENKSGLESIAISLAFAGSLLLFNSFINWLVQGQLYRKSNISNSLFAFSTILIAISLLIFYVHKHPKIENSDMKVIINKNDSMINLKENYMKDRTKLFIDSLKKTFHTEVTTSNK